MWGCVAKVLGMAIFVWLNLRVVRAFSCSARTQQLLKVNLAGGQGWFV